ncbi:MAG: shikimate dehydrogenase [Candidatus Omnitrophota bacterium]
MRNADHDRKKYGLLGRNISYSLSPAMHNACFRHFGIPAEYGIFDVQGADNWNKYFTELVSGENVAGLNVTVPYKIEIHDMLKNMGKAHRLDDIAAYLGSVNTVKIENGEYTGYNTDGPGFYGSLIDDAGFDPAGKKVFICGAGGAGRAICMYLSYLEDKGPECIFIYDTDSATASRLEADCAVKSEKIKCKAVKEDDIPDAMAGCGLAVNATPLGTKPGDPDPLPVDRIKAGMVIYDLVYARETGIIKSARQKGARAVNGIGMLVNQGALAFNIWTGCPVNETKKVMRAALKNLPGGE